MPYKNKADWNAWNTRRWIRNQEEFRTLKSNPCTDCGNNYPYYIMEFDHVPERGEKLYNIAELANQKVTSARCKKELAKCDLVCANCHKIRGHMRGYLGLSVNG